MPDCTDQNTYKHAGAKAEISLKGLIMSIGKLVKGNGIISRLEIFGKQLGIAIRNPAPSLAAWRECGQPGGKYQRSVWSATISRKLELAT